MSKVINNILFGFSLFALVSLSATASAITNTLPQIQAVYGGSIHGIDVIEPDQATNQVRIFVSTESSANSIFYADLNHSATNIFATNNFRFRVVPDFNAQANRGTVSGIAGHEESGRLFVADDMALVSCTMTAGSLVTNLPSSDKGVGDTPPPPSGAQFLGVCIRDSVLVALASSNNANKLYFGTLSSVGTFTEGDGSPINVGLNISMSSDIGLVVNPSNQCVYVIDSTGSNGIRKSSDPCASLSGATTFSTIALPAAAASWTGNKRLGFGPDGRMFIAAASGSNKVIAYSDDDGGTWTVVDTGVGGVTGSNIGTSSLTNYSVIFGSAFSTNKGEAGSWLSLGAGGGPNQTHANDGAGAFDPLNPLILFCASDQGIASSLTGGFTLFEIDYGLEAVAIQDLDMNADKTLAWTASKSGLRRGTGVPMALEWTPDGTFPTGDGSPYYSIAIDQSDTSGNTVYAGNGNIYKSTDGGTNWTRVWALESNTNGFPNTGHFSALAAYGQNIIAGFYSGSGGTTYGTGGLLISQDGGLNWVQAISSMDVNDVLLTENNSVLVAAVYNASSGKGGIYSLSSSSGLVRELSDNVSIRCFAPDSAGGIYACGQDADFAIKIYYKLLSDSSWTEVTANGLPTQSQMVSGSGPVMTVGNDSSSNDLPVMVVGHSLYYLQSGASTWQTSSALTYPDGSQINVLYWDELMVGTSEGLYSQDLGIQPVVITLADPAMVDSAGDWYVWFSGSGYQRGGPWNLGVSGTPVAGDFDGDRYTDCAIVDNAGAWYVWFTSLGYQMGGPWSLGVSGTPVAGDFDGDEYADPAMVSSSGAWRVWFTSLGYQMGGPWSLGVSGTPVAADFDGDGYADPAMVSSSGAWRVWFTSLGYQMGGPWSLGVSGTPVAADFDGDGYADPAMVSSTGAWRVWFTSLGYQMGGPWSLGVSGTPVAGDFDGDGYGDPAMVDSAGAWRVWYTSLGYQMGGPYSLGVSGTPLAADFDGQ